MDWQMRHLNDFMTPSLLWIVSALLLLTAWSQGEVGCCSGGRYQYHIADQHDP